MIGFAYHIVVDSKLQLESYLKFLYLLYLVWEVASYIWLISDLRNSVNAKGRINRFCAFTVMLLMFYQLYSGDNGIVFATSLLDKLWFQVSDWFPCSESRNFSSDI